MDIWNTEWHKTTENKLREIKHSVEPWSQYIDLNLRENIMQVQFSTERVRIGHTKFIHGQLENTEQVTTLTKLCPTCNTNKSTNKNIAYCLNLN